jgi:hypothetical protein
VKLGSYRKNAAVHIMIYGEPFTGKSTLAATVALQPGRRIIWIAVDNSIVHLEKLPPEAQDRIDFIPLPDSRDNPVGYLALRRIFKRLPAKLCHLHGAHECAWCAANNRDFSLVDLRNAGAETTVVIDHITQIVSSALSVAIRYSVNHKEVDANNRKFDTSNMDEALDYFKPGYGQWQYLWNFMEGIFQGIQSAPYNVVAISHVVETKLEDGNKRLVPHGGSDRFSRNVTRYFDHIITSEVYNGKHKFSSTTTASTSLIAGSRNETDINNFLDSNERPTLLPFFTGEIPTPPRELLEEGVEAANNVLGFGTPTVIQTPAADSKLAAALASLNRGRR